MLCHPPQSRKCSQHSTAAQRLYFPLRWLLATFLLLYCRERWFLPALLNQLFHLLLVMRRDALLRDGLREQKVCFILTSGDRNFFEDRPLEISSRKLPLNFKDTAIAALTELPYKGPSRPDSVQFRLCHVHQSFLFYPASTHINGRTVPPESVKFARCRLGMDARSTKYPSRNHHQHVPPY